MKGDADGGGEAAGCSGRSAFSCEFGRGAWQRQVVGRFLVRGRYAVVPGNPAGPATRSCHVRRQLDAVADRHGRMRPGRRRVCRGPAGPAAKRHAGRRPGHPGAAVRHRPRGRQSADHHGHVLGLHRRVQLCRGIHGRRSHRLRGHHGRLDHRRSLRNRSWLLLEAAAQVLPVHRHGHGCPLHRFEPHQRGRQRFRRR